jgi:hypothetical protein
MRNSEVEPPEKQAVQKSKSASRKFVVAPRSLGLIASNAVVFTNSFGDFESKNGISTIRRARQSS